MSLSDLFRRPAPERPTLALDDVRRLGRLEAEVETLRLQWAGYRDELKRLANRLEKRDQRAEAREEQARGAAEAEPVFPEVDEISRRVLARRNASRTNGLSQ